MIRFPFVSAPEHKVYSHQEMLNFAKFMKGDLPESPQETIQQTIDALLGGSWGCPLVMSQNPEDGHIRIHSGEHILWAVLAINSGEVEDVEPDAIEYHTFPVVVYDEGILPHNINSPAY